MSRRFELFSIIDVVHVIGQFFDASKRDRLLSNREMNAVRTESRKQVCLPTAILYAEDQNNAIVPPHRTGIEHRCYIYQ